MAREVDQNLQIVLVEDSPLLREMMSEALESLSYVSVVAFADGQDRALAEIESFRPGLVIIDLELLQGDGIGVLRALQDNPEKYGAPLKIVYTNHNSPQLNKRCHLMGIEGYFDKSYQQDELLNYVQSLALSRLDCSNASSHSG